MGRAAAGVRSYLVASLGALGAVGADPRLRGYTATVGLLDLAQFTSAMAIWLYVFRRGGTSGIAWLVVIGSGTVALLAAPVGNLADRLGRGRIATIGALLRALALAAIAVSVAATWPVWTTLALAGVEGAVYAVGAPALRALAPSLVRTPTELGAVNLTLSLSSSLAIFAGPLAGGIGDAWLGAAPVISFAAGAFVLGTVALIRLERQTAQAQSTEARAEASGGIWTGVRLAASDARIRTVLAVFSGYSFAVGIVDVTLLVLARRTLHQGGSGAGAMYAAFGIGGLLAGLLTRQLERRPLGRTFGAATALWALPLVLLAIAPGWALALAAGTLAGTAAMIVQSSGDTLLQRIAPDELLARVLGVYETLTGTVYVIAAFLPALLASVLGVRLVLAAGVIVAPVSVLLSWRGLRRLDELLGRDNARLDLLEKVPWLAHGALAERTRLTSRFREERVPAGAVVFYQGEIGVSFFVVRSGGCRVLVDGAPVRRLSSGDSFGEIALLHDVPRTATVQATEPTELLSLSEDDFRRAMTAAGDQPRRLGLGSSTAASGLVWPERSRQPAGVPVPELPAIEDLSARERVLRTLPLLAGVADPALRQLADGAPVEHYRPGEAIFREGDSGGAAYLVWSGRLQVTHQGQPVRQTHPGELVGEVAALHGGARTATVEALEDTVLLSLGSQALEAALQAGVVGAVSRSGGGE
jgi:CRP-like cAMP-binding protein